MRKLALFAGGFSLGIFLSQYLLPEAWLLPGAFLFLAAGWAAFLLPWKLRRRCVVLFAALALALGWNWLYTLKVQRPMDALAGTEGTAVMTLCGYPEATGYGARAAVELAGFPRGRAMFYGDASLLELEPGQTVRTEAAFRSAARIRDTDVTSFTAKGVFLLILGRGEPSYGPGNGDSLRWLPLRLGRAMGEKIRTLYPGDAAGFLTAVLTGDKSGLGERDGIALSEAGLYHVMAVSGMHCGFLLALVRILTGNRRRLTAALGVPVLVFYALLSGGSPSVVRSCVMLSFLMAAPLARRDGDAPTALTAALFGILLANPFAAASVSLQLSFAAVAGILFLTPRMTRALAEGRSRGASLLIAGLSSTLGALVFTTPLTAWYFGRLVLASPLGNLLCLWAVELVFVLGLASVAAGFLWMPLARVLALIPRGLIWYVSHAAHLLAALPGHALYTANPYLKYWLVYAYVLFALPYLLRVRGRRAYTLAAVLASVTLLVTVQLGQRRCAGDLDIFVLDVGQGQSVLMVSQGHAALVDCGSGNSWISAGETAADHLASLGIRRLDALILTHYDSDHVSGVTALTERLPVEKLVAPVPREDGGGEVLLAAAEAGVPVEFRRETGRIPLGEAVLTVYPPMGTGSSNEGVSVLGSVGEADVLVTGDMSRASEKKLLAACRLPDIEYLVAGHHGSASSTSEELLRALRPEVVCISVGSNSYGHPAEETLERLARRGCTVLRTDLRGDIHLSLNRER